MGDVKFVESNVEGFLNLVGCYAVSLCDSHRHFEGSHCLCLQDQAVKGQHVLTPKVKALRSFERQEVLTRMTRHNIPKVLNLLTLATYDQIMLAGSSDTSS